MWWIKHLYNDFLQTDTAIKITWEDFESQQLENKAEKSKITVIKDEVKLFVISIFNTTGRLQIQGQHYEEWTAHEFPLLLHIVNLIAEKIKDNDKSAMDLNYKLFEYSIDSFPPDDEKKSNDSIPQDEESKSKLKYHISKCKN